MPLSTGTGPILKMKLASNVPAATIVVANNGALSPAIRAILHPTFPAIVTSDGKQAVAVHGDYSAVTSQNPAHSGEAITFYGTGFGPVTPLPATGAQAGSSPLSMMKPAPTDHHQWAECDYTLRSPEPRVRRTLPVQRPYSRPGRDRQSERAFQHGRPEPESCDHSSAINLARALPCQLRRFFPVRSSAISETPSEGRRPRRVGTNLPTHGPRPFEMIQLSEKWPNRAT